MKGKTKPKANTVQCWFPRHKLPVLSTCGVCHQEGFIVTSFYNLKHIPNNHYNIKVAIIITIIINLAVPLFPIYIFFFPLSIFLFKFSFFAKYFLKCCLVSIGPLALGHYWSTKLLN